MVIGKLLYWTSLWLQVNYNIGLAYGYR